VSVLQKEGFRKHLHTSMTNQLADAFTKEAVLVVSIDAAD